MSQQPSAIRELPAEPNPYTDADPLVVRDHPWKENRAALILAIVVLAIPVALVIARAAQGKQPLLDGSSILALSIGVPLAALIAAFPVIISSRAKVTLGASQLTRAVAARRGPTKTIDLTSIRGGIYASKIRYRREYGKELVLFLADREILWIADGIAADDVERLARALSSCGIKEYTEPISNEKLQQLVRRARADQPKEP